MKTLLNKKISALLALTVCSLAFLAGPVQAASDNQASCVRQHAVYHTKPTLVVHARENCQRVEFSALEQATGEAQKATPAHYLTPGKPGYNHHIRS